MSVTAGLGLLFAANWRARSSRRKSSHPVRSCNADEAKSYDSLHALFETKRIGHSNSYAEGEISTNQAESFHSRVCRSEKGAHHRIAVHLAPDATEIAWREVNRRISNGEQFLTITAAGLHRPVSRMWKGYWQRRKPA